MLLRLARWLATLVLALVVPTIALHLARHGVSPHAVWVGSVFLSYALALAIGAWSLRESEEADRPKAFLAVFCLQVAMYATYWGAVLLEGTFFPHALRGSLDLGGLALVLAVICGPFIGFLVAVSYARAGRLLFAEFVPWIWFLGLKALSVLLPS